MRTYETFYGPVIRHGKTFKISVPKNLCLMIGLEHGDMLKVMIQKKEFPDR